MRMVTKREFTRQTFKVLDEIAAGETVVVTERGVAKWRIVSTERPVDPTTRLGA